MKPGVSQSPVQGDTEVNITFVQGKSRTPRLPCQRDRLQVPTVHTVQKTVEILEELSWWLSGEVPQTQFIDRVRSSWGEQRGDSTNAFRGQVVLRLRVAHIDKVVDVPVVMQSCSACVHVNLWRLVKESPSFST